MQRRLQLDPQLPLGDALATAFEAMVVEARTRAEAAIDEPHPSLHNYRRARRRAEALLALAAPFLRGRQRRWLEDAVAHGRRKTRLLRDLDAVSGVIELLDTLDALDRDEPGEEMAEESSPPETSEARAADSEPTAAPPAGLAGEDGAASGEDGGKTEESQAPASRHAGLMALVEAFRGELATSELIAWRLRKNLRALAGLSSIFKAGLGYVDEANLAASARNSYRHARQLLATAKKKGTADAIHAFRKGARTLRYQLELLASAETASADTIAAAEGVARLVSMLGDLTDIFALRAIVRATDRKTLGESPKKLVKRLDVVATAKVAEIFELATAVFAAKPKAFLATPEEAETDVEDGGGTDPENAAGALEESHSPAAEGEPTPAATSADGEVSTSTEDDAGEADGAATDEDDTEEPGTARRRGRRR